MESPLGRRVWVRACMVWGSAPNQKVDLDKKVIMGTVASFKDNKPIANAVIEVGGDEICQTPAGETTNLGRIDAAQLQSVVLTR